MNDATEKNYLIALTAIVAEGLSRMPARFRSKHADYVVAAQRGDGGFAGRLGASDIYYTSFALRCAEILDCSDQTFWQRAGAYLSALSPPGDVVECVSLLHSRRLVRTRVPGGDWAAEPLLARAIENILMGCRAEGGYSRSSGDAASVYHTFLASLCYSFLDSRMPDTDAAVQFVCSRQCAAGGFNDATPPEPGDEGQTNATAAAVSFLRSHDALPAAVGTRAAQFLLSLQRAEGGFAAHPGAPQSDLLSTFTALTTLGQLESVERVRLSDVARFLKGVVARDGGFRGAILDTQADLEYTYYGLGVAGLLMCQMGRAAASRPREAGQPASAEGSARAAQTMARPSSVPAPRVSSESATGLVVEHVAKQFDSPAAPLAVLSDISFALARGEGMAIIGPSGSGKSTLLHIIGTLDRPTAGRVLLANQDVTALAGTDLAVFRNQRIGFIFQDHHLLPQCTALENVMVPTLAAASAGGDVRKKAEDLLACVGVSGRMHAFPPQLSGGERQRVAIARAMINQPQLLLCDEPTGNLDQETGARIGDLFIEIARERHAILVVVTHNLSLARRFSRCMELRAGVLRERDLGPAS
jgi:lipoprotein-releasing system ATP-binding protein